MQFWLKILLFMSSMQGQFKDGVKSDFHQKKIETQVIQDDNFNYKKYDPKESDNIILRLEYADRLYGFWLGQCIANWTGLITEMDKIGNVGEIKTGKFYTREDWGKPDYPNIWSTVHKKDSTILIDFVFEDASGIWGADDDTDIEYIYQYLLHKNQTSALTGQQIRDGWISHIKKDEENYLWVSNQKAYDLMLEGMTPPSTSAPENNPHYDMIDAQLTTEIFGLFAPGRPDIALELCKLPILTTARDNAKWIAEFYVIMHSLASYPIEHNSIKNQIKWMANHARKRLPEYSYAAKMFDFVKKNYDDNIPWEVTRDRVYERYQVYGEDGYDVTSRNLYCNGCFAAGINFASSIISLFYGEGDIKETIKIGTLAGWDSDNPTATWGGLLGFIIGRKGIEKSFNRKFSSRYNIHRTRVGFPNNGIDTFENMARIGILIIDRVVQDYIGGGINLQNDQWYIPNKNLNIPVASE